MTASSKSPSQKITFASSRGGENYVAKTEENSFALPASVVETAVLKKAAISPVLRTDGTVMGEPSGLDDEVIEAALTNGSLKVLSLSALVEQALAPHLLSMEDDPKELIAVIEQELNRARAAVEQARSSHQKSGSRPGSSS